MKKEEMVKELTKGVQDTANDPGEGSPFLVFVWDTNKNEMAMDLNIQWADCACDLALPSTIANLGFDLHVKKF